MSATSESTSRATRQEVEPPPLWQHPAFALSFCVFVAAAFATASSWDTLSGVLYDAEFGLADRFAPQGSNGSFTSTYLLLPLVAFGAGLLASISPCVLPMVPLNIAYIGAHEASGLRAFGLSLRFALGAALALSVLGLFGDVAGFLLIEQRGIMLLIAGLALIYFGLMIVEIAPDPLAGRDFVGARRLGPFGAGAAFSVVTTPCTSPLLGGVLVAAAANPAPGLSVLTMLAFSLGYTALVFFGGIFGGGLVATARQLNFAAPRAIAAGLLLACGLGFAWTGIAWF